MKVHLEGQTKNKRFEWLKGNMQQYITDIKKRYLLCIVYINWMNDREKDDMNWIIRSGNIRIGQARQYIKFCLEKVVREFTAVKAISKKNITECHKS